MTTSRAGRAQSFTASWVRQSRRGLIESMTVATGYLTRVIRRWETETYVSPKTARSTQAGLDLCSVHTCRSSPVCEKELDLKRQGRRFNRDILDLDTRAPNVRIEPVAHAIELHFHEPLAAVSNDSHATSLLLQHDDLILRTRKRSDPDAEGLVAESIDEFNDLRWRRRQVRCVHQPGGTRTLPPGAGV